jgi:hypothetical protein
MKSSYLQYEVGHKNFSMNTGMFGGTPTMGMFSVGDTLTITINNTTASPQQVDLLSRTQPSGVKVASNTIPIQSLITRVQANPMQIQSMKINVSNPNQLSVPLYITYKDALGSMQQTSIVPETYKSSFQTIGNMVEIPDFNGLLDVDSSIETTINPTTTMSLTMKVKQLFDNKKQFMDYLNFMEQKKFRNFMREITM